MSDLVIAGGLVVNADGRRMAHVVVEGDKVARVVDADQPVPDAPRTIDAQGRVVVPGGVDAHCHVAQVTGRFRTMDDYRTTSIAALWGGNTTILDFGIPRDPSESPLDAALGKMRLAEESRCDVGLHASVIHWDDTVPEQLERLADLGVRSVKLYMSNRGTTMADNDTVLQVMDHMVRLDGLTFVHAEHDPIIHACTEQHARAGRVGVEYLHHTRPELAEEASVQEVIALSEFTGAPVYFVHQSTPRAVDLVTEARARGLELLSETCPHYVVLDDSCYGTDMPEWYACCPPMRSKETVASLRGRLMAGAIDAVSSDHSCYDLSQKRVSRADVRAMPHGLPGVETRLPVTLSALLTAAGTQDPLAPGLLERFVELTSTGPATINALESKGEISEGFDADLVVMDPHQKRLVDRGYLHMGTDFSPFQGLETCGWPETVLARGQIVLDRDGFHDPGPVGKTLAQSGFREFQRRSQERRPVESFGARR